MNINTFKKLPENGPVKKYVGEIFLEGEHIVKQKFIKNPGDMVTYYEIVKLTDSGYESIAMYEKLTK